MREYRIVWTAVPTSHNQAHVLFLDALDEDHAKKLAKDKIERETGIARFVIDSVTLAAKSESWISLGESVSPYFVAVDTEMNHPDLTGPFGTYGEAQEAADAIKYDTYIMRMVRADAPTGEAEVKQDERWGSFRDDQPRSVVVDQMRQIIADTGSEIEVVGALVVALKDLAKSIPDEPAGFVNELVRRIVSVTQ